MHEQEYIQIIQFCVQIPTHRLPDLKHTSTPSPWTKSRVHITPPDTVYAECKKKKSAYAPRTSYVQHIYIIRSSMLEISSMSLLKQLLLTNNSSQRMFPPRWNKLCWLWNKLCTKYTLLKKWCWGDMHALRAINEILLLRLEKQLLAKDTKREARILTKLLLDMR